MTGGVMGERGVCGATRSEGLWVSVGCVWNYDMEGVGWVWGR